MLTKLFSVAPYNKPNTFLGLIEYELNSMRGANQFIFDSTSKDIFQITD